MYSAPAARLLGPWLGLSGPRGQPSHGCRDPGEAQGCRPLAVRTNPLGPLRGIILRGPVGISRQSRATSTLHQGRRRPTRPPCRERGALCSVCTPARGAGGKLTLAASRAGKSSGRKASLQGASLPPAAWIYPPAEAGSAPCHRAQTPSCRPAPPPPPTCLTPQLQLPAHGRDTLQGLHLGQLLPELLMDLQPETNAPSPSRPQVEPLPGTQTRLGSEPPLKTPNTQSGFRPAGICLEEQLTCGATA